MKTWTEIMNTIKYHINTDEYGYYNYNDILEVLDIFEDIIRDYEHYDEFTAEYIMETLINDEYYND